MWICILENTCYEFLFEDKRIIFIMKISGLYSCLVCSEHSVRCFKSFEIIDNHGGIKNMFDFNDGSVIFREEDLDIAKLKCLIHAHELGWDIKSLSLE